MGNSGSQHEGPLSHEEEVRLREHAIYVALLLSLSNSSRQRYGGGGGARPYPIPSQPTQKFQSVILESARAPLRREPSRGASPPPSSKKYGDFHHTVQVVVAKAAAAPPPPVDVPAIEPLPPAAPESPEPLPPEFLRCGWADEQSQSEQSQSRRSLDEKSSRPSISLPDYAEQHMSSRPSISLTDVAEQPAGAVPAAAAAKKKKKEEKVVVPVERGLLEGGGIRRYLVKHPSLAVRSKGHTKTMPDAPKLPSPLKSARVAGEAPTLADAVRTFGARFRSSRFKVPPTPPSPPATPSAAPPVKLGHDSHLDELPPALRTLCRDGSHLDDLQEDHARYSQVIKSTPGRLTPQMTPIGSPRLESAAGSSDCP